MQTMDGIHKFSVLSETEERASEKPAHSGFSATTCECTRQWTSLDGDFLPTRISIMTVEEWKRGIEESTPEQRLFLSAYSKHLARKDDPAYQAELSQLNREIDDGKKVHFGASETPPRYV